MAKKSAERATAELLAEKERNVGADGAELSGRAPAPANDEPERAGASRVEAGTRVVAIFPNAASLKLATAL